MKKFLYGLIIFALVLNSLPLQAAQISNSNGIYIPANGAVSLAPPLSVNDIVGHYNNKVKIVFSDIDGTLIPLNCTDTRNSISSGVKNAIKKLKAANIPVILVTGRSYGEAKEIAKAMDDDNTYIVVLQGTQVMDGHGKIIYQDAIKDSDVDRILNSINSFVKTYNMDPKIYAHVDGKPYATQKFILPFNWEPFIYVKSFDVLKGQSFNKFGIYDTNHEKLKLLQECLKKEFPNYRIDLTTDFTCDVSPAVATKGHGVEKLAEILGIDLKNAAVFGDAENDISMLSVVKQHGGLAIAVGNAMDNLKKNCNCVTSTVNDDGFARAVDKILENNALLERRVKK